MIIREIELKDLEALEELNKVQNGFKLDNINHCISDRVIEEDGKIIAYGILKHMAEAVFLAHPKANGLTRAKAMRELMLLAEVYAKGENCEQLHVFVKDPVLVKSLVRHFNFRKIDQIPLVKDIKF